MKTVMLVFGTRPEAIKWRHYVAYLKVGRVYEPNLCLDNTGKCDQVLEIFNLTPDIDLTL